MSDLHITVAATPDNSDFRNPRIIDHDLRLLKASILYADRVKLCSIGAWMVTNVYLIGSKKFSQAEQLEFIISLLPTIDPEKSKTLLPQFEQLYSLFKRNPLFLTKKQRRIKIGAAQIVQQGWKEFQERIAESTNNVGFGEIETLVNLGLLEIHSFSSTNINIGKEAVHEYFSAVKNILNNTSTHPMLDQETNELVRLASQEGKLFIRNSGTRKSKQIGLVANLFDRLPVFDIKMDELLDLREELHKPLVYFRSEMVKLSNDIESATWDKDFSSDVQETFQTKVEPALLEIEDKLKSTQFSEFWSRRIVDKYGYLAGTAGTSFAMGAAVAPWAGIGTALLAGIGTSLASGAVFTKAGLSELREKNRRT